MSLLKLLFMKPGGLQVKSQKGYAIPPECIYLAQRTVISLVADPLTT